MERTLLKILTCCSILLFFNCQNDDFIKETDAHAHENGIIINRISGQELKAKVPLVFKKAQSLNQLKNTDALARGVIIDDEYEVETDEVIEISKDGITHYTFSISRTVPTDLVENLVISVDADGILSGKIVTYDLTEEEKQAVALKNYLNLTDKTSVKEIENINNVTDLFSRAGDCITVVMGGDSCPNGHTPEQQASGGCDLVKQGLFTPNVYVVQIIVDGDCINGGGGSEGGGGTTNPTNPGTNPTNPGTGGGGGNYNPNPNPNPVITTPLLEVRKNLKPCAQLKKMTNSIPSYDSNIQFLKDKSNGKKEYAWAFDYVSTSNTFLPGTVVGQLQSNPDQVDLSAVGDNCVGAAHNHTNPNITTGISMFSPADLKWLFTRSRKHNPPPGQVKDFSIYFLLMVIGDRNYAIKITDQEKLQLNFNSMFPKIETELKKKYNESTQFASAFTLQKDLLNVLKKYDIGMGLFEETETNGNKEWSELKLDPIHPNANPIRKACN